jgi:hypothetical protein
MLAHVLDTLLRVKKRNLNMTGKKFDAGKPRMGLVAPEFTSGIAEVLTFGADKYGAYNWAEGIDFDRVYDAAQRHLSSWWMGEDLDTETGKNHLLHAACELMFLYCYQQWEMNNHDNRHIRNGIPDKLRLHIPESVSTT